MKRLETVLKIELALRNRQEEEEEQFSWEPAMGSLQEPRAARNDTDHNVFMWPSSYLIGGGAASSSNNNNNDRNDNNGNFTPISSDDSNTEQEIIGVATQ